MGVDAPEKGAQGADASREALKGLIEGKRVEILKIDEDRYDRLVGRVFLDGRDVSTLLLQAGHAVEYCKYSKGFYGTCK